MSGFIFRPWNSRIQVIPSPYHSNPVVFNWGQFCPPWEIWQHLETFLAVTTDGCYWHVVQRPGMPPYIPQCPQQLLITVIWSQMSVVPRLKNHTLTQPISKSTDQFSSITITLKYCTKLYNETVKKTSLKFFFLWVPINSRHTARPWESRRVSEIWLSD